MLRLSLRLDGIVGGRKMVLFFFFLGFLGQATAVNSLLLKDWHLRATIRFGTVVACNDSR